mmetsp:Transcript_23641/g.44661  ORF Transcript_23641/g.44661 Transcript_23641/m.44661 type:complete len:194 (-) Transcript_23641:93-674(-)
MDAFVLHRGFFARGLVVALALGCAAAIRHDEELEMLATDGEHLAQHFKVEHNHTEHRVGEGCDVPAVDLTQDEVAKSCSHCKQAEPTDHCLAKCSFHLRVEKYRKSFADLASHGATLKCIVQFELPLVKDGAKEKERFEASCRKSCFDEEAALGDLEHEIETTFCPDSADPFHCLVMIERSEEEEKEDGSTNR